MILTTHLDHIAVKFPRMSEDVGNTSRLVRGNVGTMKVVTKYREDTGSFSCSSVLLIFALFHPYPGSNKV